MGNRGRKRKLKISELVDVKQKISEGAFKLNTLTMPEVRTEMQKTILEKNGINSHADRTNLPHYPRGQLLLTSAI